MAKHLCPTCQGSHRPRYANGTCSKECARAEWLCRSLVDLKLAIIDAAATKGA